jgi:hypothetical protein
MWPFCPLNSKPYTQHPSGLQWRNGPKTHCLCFWAKLRGCGMNQEAQSVTTISPFLADVENPAEEWLDRLDCVLTRLYTERGSFPPH